MSIKNELSELAKETQNKLKRIEGQLHGVSSNWPEIVRNYCEQVYDSASSGKEKHFFDMKDLNQATITKVSIEMKSKLGDVLIIVSPRGIEANWEMID